MGGEAMIAAAVEGVAEGAARAPARVIAVTLLTSLEPESLPPGFARPFAMHRTLAAMLAMAERQGAAGIVCSASDLTGIRSHHPEPFLAVTPGIRLAHGERDDQRRVTTVSQAVQAGASILVLGRAVTGAADPAEALRAARQECHRALAGA